MIEKRHRVKHLILRKRRHCTHTQTHRRWGSSPCQRSLQAQRRPISGSWSSSTWSHCKQRLPTSCSSWCCRWGRAGSPLSEASFPLPSPEPWPNTHTLSCQQGHSWEPHLPSLCETPAGWKHSPGSAWVVWVPLYCRGIRYVTSQADKVHPLPLMPQDGPL